MRRILLAAAGLLAAIALCVVRVPPGDAALRAWRGGGTPTLLGPGFSLRLPWLQSVERFRRGRVTIRGTISAASREGTSVGLPYDATLVATPQQLLQLGREGGASGARGALAASVEKRLAEVAAGVGTYDLASGSTRAAMESRVRDGLQQIYKPSPLEVHLGDPVVPPEVRASFERQSIYARRQETGLQVVLIGLDGADWDVIDPMIARGELPNLARLKRRGAWARLRSSIPTLSPLLWTTVATGKSPDRHGINDFLVEDPATGRRVPINSTFRRVRAFWNILSEAGLNVDVVAWWATWPAEAIRGHLISDRVAYSTFRLGAVGGQAGAVHPAAYAATVQKLRVPEDSITWRQVSRFLHIGESEFRAARAAGTPPRRGEARKAAPTEAQQSINTFVRVLAATETYRNIALDLLAHKADQPRVFAVYFQGIDEVNHRFAHCEPPHMALCSDADYRRFRDAVFEFYRYQDEVLGEILSKTPDATVLVLSDHGFASGEGRPADVKPFIEGKPGLWHDMTGMFAAAGPGIARGEVPSVTLYDITPTLLHLVGLPVPEDMPGKVIEAALTADFRSAHPVRHVPSYEGLAPPGGGKPGDRREARALTGGADEEIVEQLRSLGYIGGAGETGTPASAAPPSGAPAAGPAEGATSAPAPASRGGPGAAVPTLLYHTNLAAVLMGRRQFDQAEQELRKAQALEPDAPEVRSAYGALYELEGKTEKALEILRGLVGTDPDYAASRLIKMAQLYVRMGRAADGIEYFQGLGSQADARTETGRRVALGIAQAAAGRKGEAERSLSRALDLDPASVPAMQELFGLLDAQGRAADLKPRLERALRREPRGAMLHNWLGLVLKRQGDLKGAEMQFRQALDSAPDLVGCMANLGGLYLQEGRATEAVAVLESAVEKDARNIEARTNLIVALGLEHDVESARARLEAAEKQGQKAAVLYNALAYALHLNGHDQEALDTLARALAIDPRQPDALKLRREIETGGADAGLAYR